MCTNAHVSHTHVHLRARMYISLCAPFSGVTKGNQDYYFRRGRGPRRGAGPRKCSYGPCARSARRFFFGVFAPNITHTTSGLDWTGLDWTGRDGTGGTDGTDGID